MIMYFSSEIRKAVGSGKYFLSIVTCQYGILYSMKIFFRNEGKSRDFKMKEN